MARNNSSFTYLPPLLFSATLFTSAALLFWIQPLIGKTLLPFWGGVPAVWNTCLLFFQGMLLVGYLYALASSRWLNLSAQITVHLILLVVIAIYLWLVPVQATVSSSLANASPTVSILGTLLFTVGLPFFIISASNPLLQAWFSKSQHYRAIDPYFLFAASNAGSLIALLAFPLVLEPNLGLSEQHRWWRVGFAVLVTLICIVAFVGLKASAAVSQGEAVESGLTVTVLRRLRWLALSFVPSSLMLGVTTYITTDVAAVPLLWVIPLALYLLTFVLAFTKKQFASAALLRRVTLVAALVVTLIFASGATQPAWALIFANLGFLFVAGLTCHKQLADDRPSTAHLSEYYLWIALGGALGSFFNVFVAPTLFNSVLEYPLAIILACMLQSWGPRLANGNVEQRNYLDLVHPLGLYLLTVGLAILVTYSGFNSPTFKLIIVLVVPLMIINHFFRQRPMRFALGLAAVMLGSVHYAGDAGHTVHVDRNFFGTIRVTTESMSINNLYSGNTIHGRQFVDQSRRCEPLSYHHELGPLGQVMAVFNAAPANQRVAVIGLGVGAMAAYSRPAQEWTFYEINPDVIALASNSQHFTYLQNCASGSVSVVEGDARLKLQTASTGHYGLIVLDAFSSDAIPVHLLTQQSLDLYLSKLAEGGILAFHISSRTLDLKPILADLAQSRKLVCIGFDDLKPSSVEGKDPSQWVVMARSEAEISNLSINTQWKRLEGSGARVWSDDFSNIVRAIRWD
ncbi:MAG TPA: fused MFS/spermidine synthase [Pyrinomonadaceae bacterium]